jgi:hypothetical protein
MAETPLTPGIPADPSPAAATAPAAEEAVAEAAATVEPAAWAVEELQGANQAVDQGLALEPEPVAAGEPAIAAILEVPPLPAGEAGEGGEFDLLIGKLRAWFDNADLGGQWQKLRGPLKGLALLVLAILALRLYARLVGTLDSIPVVSGLLELTGLIYLLWFSATRLLRTREREQVFADWKRRWQAFSGRD